MKTAKDVAVAEPKPAFKTEAEAHKAKLRKANELLATANLSGLPNKHKRTH